MFEIILYQPEIPPNTGNVIRLAANTGCRLHLVKPLGFDLSDRNLRRAGLDYHEFADLRVHDDWPSLRAALPGRRLFAFTTKATSPFAATVFQPGDGFVFGPETRGIPDEIRAEFPADRRLRLPMLPGQRSLNLSNAVAVVVFEAWRQNGYAGGLRAPPPPPCADDLITEPAMSALENFEKLLAAGKDNVLLRYSLGNEYHKLGRFEAARAHLEAALAFDPRYSAAWKLLARTLADSGALAEALATYRRGIAAAEAKGDLQAAKEMRVFARRIEKQLADPSAG